MKEGTCVSDELSPVSYGCTWVDIFKLPFFSNVLRDLTLTERFQFLRVQNQATRTTLIKSHHKYFLTEDTSRDHWAFWIKKCFPALLKNHVWPAKYWAEVLTLSQQVEIWVCSSPARKRYSCFLSN